MLHNNSVTNGDTAKVYPFPASFVNNQLSFFKKRRSRLERLKKLYAAKYEFHSKMPFPLEDLLAKLAYRWLLTCYRLNSINLIVLTKQRLLEELLSCPDFLDLPELKENIFLEINPRELSEMDVVLQPDKYCFHPFTGEVVERASLESDREKEEV